MKQNAHYHVTEGGRGGEGERGGNEEGGEGGIQWNCSWRRVAYIKYWIMLKIWCGGGGV